MFAKLNSSHLSPMTIKPWLLAAALPAALCFGCGDDSADQGSNTPVSQASTEVEALEFTLVKSDKAHDEAPEVSEEKFSRHVSANQDFSFELHREVSPDQSNVMISAWSVRQAFALVLPGANEEGQAAIAETLGFSPEVDTALRSINLLNDELNARQIEGSEDQAPVVLRTANSLWADEGAELERAYLDQLSEHLDAGVHLIDFKNRPEDARQSINAWVEGETEDRIQNLIPEDLITEFTSSVFTNAVYFKAPWSTPFKETRTTEREFVTSNEEVIMTPLMRGEQSAPAAIVDGTQVLTLPFRGQDLSITFLMPTEGSVDALEASLNAERWDTLLSERVSDLREVTIPKFKFETSVPNMGDYFSERETQVLFESAAIDGVLVDQPLSISKIIHKSFIEINETGGEATAATAIVANSPSVPVYGPEVVIDRAFLFAIHDESTGAILFFGKVGNPAE